MNRKPLQDHSTTACVMDGVGGGRNGEAVWPQTSSPAGGHSKKSASIHLLSSISFPTGTEDLVCLVPKENVIMIIIALSLCHDLHPF